MGWGLSIMREQLRAYDDSQFTRYHQSQFRFKGKSRTIKDGWWAGATEGEIAGERSIMLRYEGERMTAMKVCDFVWRFSIIC